MNTRTALIRRPKQAAWAIGGLFVLAGMAGLMVQGLSEPAPESPAPELARSETTTPSSTTDTTVTGDRASTLGDLWRLIQAPEEREARENAADTGGDIPADAPFTAQGVRAALEEVRLDDNGDVVLDHATLQSLDRYLRGNDLQLTDQDVSDLQQLIRDRLPNQAGEQTARLVADYYRYLQAETEYLATTTPVQVPEDAVSSHADRYARLRQLRDQYLGPDASEKLFRVSDAHAEYMFEAYRIRNDDSLSDEEKIRKVNALNDELQQQYITIDNWQQRYQQFQADKQQILQAGLSDADKRSQIKGLLNAQFTAEELGQIEHLELDRLQ